MAEQKAKEKEKRGRPKLMVREWKVEPGEWREATEEEMKKFLGDPWRSFMELRERMRRFWDKIEEAFDELWG